VIKAVIFDCFGVLTTEGLEIFYSKYFKDEPEKLKQAKDIIGRLNRGEITHEHYIQGVSKLAGVGHDVVYEYVHDNKANEPLLQYVREKLKPKYKIGMLSNAGGDWLKELFSEKDIKLFDDIILSYKTGVTKPNRVAYGQAVNRLDVSFEETIFVDDLAHYVEAANQLGIKAIQYKNFEQTKEEIEKILASSQD
jgi:HAD superfamily hydrolase (TIGR01509 family)